MLPINIAYASDNNYAQHLGVSMISLLENSLTPQNIKFHILENGINKENIEKIKLISTRYGAKIFFYHVDKALTTRMPEIGHLSKAAYLRLFLPLIIPQEVKKIIYLDCDVIVLKEITSLNQVDLQGNGLGAAQDVKSTEIIRIYFYPGIKKYFNSGVMIIDLKFWREGNIVKQALRFIDQYSHHLTTADQDVLNCIFKNNWLELPKKYNTDLKHELINALPKDDVYILHYSDRIKPWSYLYVGKNKKYYFQYLALSPWKNYKYKDKNLKNLFKKYYLVIKKSLINILRPIAPNFLIDWNKKRFNNKIKNNKG